MDWIGFRYSRCMQRGRYYGWMDTAGTWTTIVSSPRRHYIYTRGKAQQRGSGDAMGQVQVSRHTPTEEEYIWLHPYPRYILRRPIDPSSACTFLSAALGPCVSLLITSTPLLACTT